MSKNTAGPGGYVAPGSTGGHYEGSFGGNGPDRHWVPDTPGAFQQAADATAWGNRPTQNTPNASQSWTQDANGKWTQTTGYSGPLAGANDSLQRQFADANRSPLDNGAQARQRSEDAIYGRETSRLDPQWQQREHDYQTQLVNQGIDPNSTAGKNAMDNFGRQRNDAYQQASYGAITGGGAEAQRQQQMDLQSRMAPLMGIQGLQGLLQMPGFQQGPNYLGAAQADTAARQKEADQSNMLWSDLMTGLTSLAGSFMKMYPQR